MATGTNHWTSTLQAITFATGVTRGPSVPCTHGPMRRRGLSHATDRQHIMRYRVVECNRPHLVQEISVPEYMVLDGALHVKIHINNRPKAQLVISPYRAIDKVEVLVRFKQTRWVIAVEKDSEGPERISALRKGDPTHFAAREALRKRMLLGVMAGRAGSRRYVDIPDEEDEGVHSDTSANDEYIAADMTDQ